MAERSTRKSVSRIAAMLLKVGEEALEEDMEMLSFRA
jgi:hypothetical protein